jgi:hypothetical protein
MMTVQSEPQNFEKYDYLSYIEWLEMICRICFLGFNHDMEFKNKPIAEKI